ncbi:MAG: hypothetical protein ILA52_01095, partial [Alphaproteobacteria bacterium]|nr:hypothetical protein [Alphaproteobacteria bacterium]
ATGAVLSKIPFKNGVADGQAIGYYENGRQAFQATYKNNKLNGLLTLYFDNGKINAEKMFSNGSWNGTEYREYNRQGRLILEVYNDGYSTRYVSVDASGNKKDLSPQEKEKLLKRINTPNLNDKTNDEIDNILQEEYKDEQ